MSFKIPELPPFNLPGSVACPMCGSTDISMEYRATGMCLHVNDEVMETNQMNPRMHRQCRQCRCSWDERTLIDSPETLDRRTRELRGKYGEPLPPIFREGAAS